MTTAYEHPKTASRYDPSHYNGAEADIESSDEARQSEVAHGIMRNADIMNLVGKSTMEKIIADPLRLAFYVHAVAYGGYEWEDVVKDMKREDLYDKGDKELGDLTIISEDLNKSDFYSSAEGKTAATLAGAKIPNVNVGAWGNNSALKYGRNMPDAIFKTHVPMSDTKSQAYRDAVDGVKSMYADYSDALLAADHADCWCRAVIAEAAGQAAIVRPGGKRAIRKLRRIHGDQRLRQTGSPWRRSQEDDS